MPTRTSLASTLLALSLIGLFSAGTTSGQDGAASTTQDQTAEATATQQEVTTLQPSDQSQSPQTQAEQSQAEPVQTQTEVQPSAEELAAEEARLKDLLSLVKDDTTQISKRENPAYFGLLKKILDRSVEQLNNDVATNPRFNDLYSDPEKHRGELVRLTLNARRVISIPVKNKNVANLTEVYEIWGWTEEAKAHMYCCVVAELPPGFPKDGDVDKRIDLVGYFMKMQGYQPGNAGPTRRNLVAPLIMGRITDAGPIVKTAKGPAVNWPIILIIGFGTIAMMRLMMHLMGMSRTTPTHRNYRRRSLEPIDPDTLADGLGEPGHGIRIRNAGEL